MAVSVPCAFLKVYEQWISTNTDARSGKIFDTFSGPLPLPLPLPLPFVIIIALHCHHHSPAFQVCLSDDMKTSLCSNKCSPEFALAGISYFRCCHHNLSVSMCVCAVCTVHLLRQVNASHLVWDSFCSFVFSTKKANNVECSRDV